MLVALVVAVGLAVFRDDAEATAAGCTGSADLRISAAPALASVLKGYADDFDTWVEDRPGVPCTTTQITSASPQELSASVGPRPRRRRVRRADDVGARLLAVAGRAGA